jgi:hypothetical protein
VKASQHAQYQHFMTGESSFKAGIYSEGSAIVRVGAFVRMDRVAHHARTALLEGGSESSKRIAIGVAVV